jgi:hypothetical protein
MKKVIQKIIVPAALVLAMGTQPALAAGSMQNVVQASVSGSKAVGHSLVAGGQFVAGVAAVPLIAVGVIGDVSGQAGEELWEQANGKPLPLTEETVTAALTPAEAMKTGREL